jgi:MFS family permease
MRPSLLDRAYLALFREYPQLGPLALMTGASQLAFALLNIYALPIYLVDNLHLSGRALGLASATFLAVETVLKIPMGRLSDRYGRKLFIVLGPLLISLNPTLVASLPKRLWLLVFPLRAVDGVGAAALWPPLFAVVGDLTADRRRAAAMSVVNTVYVAAIGAAVAMGAFVSHATGSDKAPFYVATGLLLCTALTAQLGLPRTRRLAEDDPPVGPDWSVALGSPALRSCPFPLVLLMSLLMTLGVLTLASFLVLYLYQDLHLSRLQTGLLLVCLGAPVLLFGIPLGHAADRWGKTRAVRISLVVSAALMWAIPSCRSTALFGGVAAVLVLSHVLGTPAWLALVSELAPARRRGGVMGAVATAEGLGAVLGPLVGGWLWDINHSHIFYGAAAFLTLAAVIALLTLRRDPRPAPG